MSRMVKSFASGTLTFTSEGKSLAIDLNSFGPLPAAEVVGAVHFSALIHGWKQKLGDSTAQLPKGASLNEKFAVIEKTARKIAQSGDFGAAGGPSKEWTDLVESLVSVGGLDRAMAEIVASKTLANKKERLASK